MPKNPFGQDDPLASGGGGTWGGAAGAGAGGFGSTPGQAAGAPAEEYDVVEIADDQLGGPSPPAKVSQNGLKGAANAKDTASREAALAKREQEVKRREAALASRGAAGIDPMMIKNFPSCCPMVHHDIINDIPEYNKAITRAGFMLFLLTCLGLTWNFVAVIIAVIVTDSTSVAAWFFAALYFVIGVPGAWFTWYGRLYRAMMSDGALSFAGFFFFFLTHTCFCIWSAVAPSFIQNGQDYAHTGWLPAIQLFKEDGGGSKFAAICYSVGASMWTVLSVFSVGYMGRVYNKMRGGNISERARQEAYAMGAQMAAEEMTRNATASNNARR